MKDDDRKSLNWHSSDDEDADVFTDALRGNKVIIIAICAVIIFFSILIYILS